MKKTFIIMMVLMLGVNLLPQAQTKAADSVVINVGERSRITVVVKDKRDLETLKSYNFQSLMNDLINKMENKDTVSAMKTSDSYLKTNNEPTPQTNREEENWKRNDNRESLTRIDRNDVTTEKQRYRGTRQAISFDFGTNNYLVNGNFPNSETDVYAVRPWGSWYLAVNSVYRTRLSRVAFLEWGFGGSLYNFAFQNDSVRVGSSVSGVNFGLDNRQLDYRRSQLSALYINTSLIPVIDFGGNYRKPVLFDGRRADSFRFGIGPYAGYRLDSFTKLVYKDNGDKKRDKDHGSYYMNNFRYGVRLQLGFKNTDVFFNYDLSPLFAKSTVPALHAISFGFSF